jgi:hypothetical protein
MYVKKNLMLCLAVFALALPLLLTGTASAKYMSDGAVSATSGTAGFIAPTDGVCVVSIDASGNMVADPTIKTARDCQAKLVSVTSSTWSGGPLSVICANPASNTAGLKYAAPGGSTCVTVDGSGFITGSMSMANLDRNAVICNRLGGQLATAVAGPLPAPTGSGITIAVGTQTVANGTAAQCLAYGWNYTSQNAAGTPLTFGAKGITPAATGTGFCSTSIRTGITPTTSCPSALTGTTIAVANAKEGYSVSGSNCLYAYGTSGVANAALTKIDGTVYAAAGATVDLTALTQGECIANGATWRDGWGFQTTGNTYGVADGWTAGTGVKFDLQKNVLNADEGCLHCHSWKAQHNGPAERFKDSYLKTGHKNMLRKVTAGQLLVGPDSVAYTTDGTNSINMAAGTVNVGGTDHTIRYVYGDWMAALPTLAYDGGSTYGCGACHTAGFRDNTNPGVQSIGISDYTPAEPAASGASFVAAVTAGHKWDLEGIGCGRCHNAAYPAVSQTTINASSFGTTAPLSSGMGALAAGVNRTNLCFGCHQSMAKKYPAQGGATNGTVQRNPTLIPTGLSHGASVGRDFNGHVLGNSFLNSVHARYQGTDSTTASGGTTTNALGKFDLVSSKPTFSASTLYASDFKGYTCWQSSVSTSPAMTKADGSEISSKAECEALYGPGTPPWSPWRPDTGSRGVADSIQGTCATCHDVHNSMFVADQKEKAMRKTCEKCHVDNATTHATDDRLPQIIVAGIKHPTGPNTPFDTKYESACAVCHMAIQAQENGNQNSMPVHVWRINTSASYNTFPTSTQWNGAGVLQDKNAQVETETYTRLDGTTGTYPNAVWVDLDLACGQCHGGSLGSGATANAAPYFDKTYLSQLAKNIHSNKPTASFTFANGAINYSINFVASSSTCTGGPCDSYAWDFGDSSLGSGVTTSHTYLSAATRTATLTVSKNGNTASISKAVFPRYAASSPVTLGAGATVTPNGFSPSVNWTISNGVAPYLVRVNWGDGTTTPVTQNTAGPGTLAHTFVTARTYTVTVFVTDAGVGGSNQTTAKSTIPVVITASASAVTGLVSTSTATPIANAALTLKLGTVVKYLAYSNASGNYTFTGVAAGTYTLSAVKSGFTFTPIPGVVSTGTGTVTQNISSVQ